MRKIICILTLLVSVSAFAQTETDALFMGKKNLCSGIIYGHSTWNKYWEGTFLRSNANLGSINSNSVMAMVNYGIIRKLNLIASTSWIDNRATAGTLLGQQGVQDLNVYLKHELINTDIRDVNTSLVAIAGVSAPLTNYVADYLPLSIGTQSKTASLRLLADAQKENWYLTASAAYVLRSEVTIDRDAYYTTEMIYSNKVAMPDLFLYNLRLGWRDGADKYFELVLDRMNTLGGFDIRKNNMPFLSNDMEFLRAGVNLKYPIPGTNGFSVMANAMQTISGRNMGRATMLNAGFTYQFEFKTREKK